MVMITSAENRTWPGDVAIPHHHQAGLPAPSVVRALKIATIEARHADRLGSVDRATLQAVMGQIQTVIADKRDA
jgi:mRNA interferase MazF